MPGSELEKIGERNRRVEADKAWEVSWTRRCLIMAGTYLVVSGYLIWLGIERPFLNAAVPPSAYLISTLTLGVAKKLWLAKVYKVPA